MISDLKASWGSGALSCPLRLRTVVSTETVAFVAQPAALSFTRSGWIEYPHRQTRFLTMERDPEAGVLECTPRLAYSTFGARVAKLDSDYSCAAVSQPPIFLLALLFASSFYLSLRKARQTLYPEVLMYAV